jgi:hypothetical protein
MAQLFKFFEEYIERRKAYEKAKSQQLLGDFSQEVAVEFPVNLDLGNLRNSIKEFAERIDEETTDKIADALLSDLTSATTNNFEVYYAQAEHVFRALRAEALRVSPYAQRVLNTAARRKFQSDENGVIDRNIVAPIESRLLDGDVQ